ncbi:MAG: hypothetical protein H6741_34050 [Alphaproteobacteria bacterium]|nr:hypothetical protein [Alphaproteobacteria bacterium]
MTQDFVTPPRPQSPLPSELEGVLRWSAVADQGTPGELLRGPRSWMQRALSLPGEGAFVPVQSATVDGWVQVWCADPIQLPVTALVGALSGPAAVALVSLAAEALRPLHDQGAHHGAISPDGVGFDAQGVLRIRPALHRPTLREPGGEEGGRATDCLALGRLLRGLLGGSFDDDAAPLPPLPGLRSGRAPLLLAGLNRARPRLRIQPAAGVVQASAALLHAEKADGEAELKALLRARGLGDALRPATRPIWLKLPEPEPEPEPEPVLAAEPLPEAEEDGDAGQQLRVAVMRVSRAVQAKDGDFSLEIIPPAPLPEEDTEDPPTEPGESLGLLVDEDVAVEASAQSPLTSEAPGSIFDEEDEDPPEGLLVFAPEDEEDEDEAPGVLVEEDVDTAPSALEASEDEDSEEASALAAEPAEQALESGEVAGGLAEAPEAETAPDEAEPEVPAAQAEAAAPEEAAPGEDAVAASVEEAALEGDAGQVEGAASAEEAALEGDAGLVEGAASAEDATPVEDATRVELTELPTPAEPSAPSEDTAQAQPAEPHAPSQDASPSQDSAPSQVPTEESTALASDDSAQPSVAVAEASSSEGSPETSLALGQEFTEGDALADAFEGDGDLAEAFEDDGDLATEFEAAEPEGEEPSGQASSEAASPGVTEVLEAPPEAPVGPEELPDEPEVVDIVDTEDRPFSATVRAQAWATEEIPADLTRDRAPAAPEASPDELMALEADEAPEEGFEEEEDVEVLSAPAPAAPSVAAVPVPAPVTAAPLASPPAKPVASASPLPPAAPVSVASSTPARPPPASPPPPASAAPASAASPTPVRPPVAPPAPPRAAPPPPRRAESEESVNILERQAGRGLDDLFASGQIGVRADPSREQELGVGKWGEEGRSLEEIARDMPDTPVRELDLGDEGEGRLSALLAALGLK